MNFFDKKQLIIIISIITIICIVIYFFTKDNSSAILTQNELYISSNDIANNIEQIKIHIDGEVTSPGIVVIDKNSRISDAIEASGGLTIYADISKVNLAYILKDGQKIYIPSIYDGEIEYIQTDAGQNIIVPDSSSNSFPININSATQEDLEKLPGVGASTAGKIIDYREKNGSFNSIEDIMNVSGIGEAKFNTMKEYICI